MTREQLLDAAVRANVNVGGLPSYLGYIPAIFGTWEKVGDHLTRAWPDSIANIRRDFAEISERDSMSGVTDILLGVRT